MRTYSFHHYNRSPTATNLSFGFLDSDEAALAHAGVLVRREALRCVEVCEGLREVGSVLWNRERGEAQVQRASAAA